MKDYLLLLDENEKLKRIINAYEFYDDEIKSTTAGERVLTFKMNDSVVDIENGNKIGVFVEGKFDLFIVDQVEAETYYSTSIKVTCLHDFYSIQTQKAITQYYRESVSLRDAMTEMLKGTSYELGECVERALIPIGPYLYKNPLWCIQDIISNFGVEIDYSIELNETRTGIARKLVNVVNALGSDTGIRCSTDLNVSKIKRVQKDKFYTVMYGCGSEYQKDLVKYKYDFKDVSWSVSNGNPTDKPAGQEFVEDKKAIAKYGRIIGIFEDGRIKDPELLLKKTWEALQKNNRPIVSYELDIEELKTEDGYEHLNFKLGDIIILQNTIDNSRAKFRIVEDCKSIRNKNKRKVVVGEQLKGIFSGGNSGNSDGTEGPGGSVIDPGGEEIQPPSLEEITPDTLPAVPVVTAKGLWAKVMLSWTYESKMYYNYEVYASRVKDFEPTVFHMIYSGKASAFLHEVGAKETWYYRVRAVNTFGHATEFSNQVEATTTKVADGTEFFESAAIKDVLIEELRLDRGWIGQLDATYLNVKGKFTVLDGNDTETFKIGSWGDITLKPSVFMLLADTQTNVPTKSELSNAIGVANSYTNAQVEIVNNKISQKVSQTEYDINKEIVNEKFAQQEIEHNKVSTTVSKIKGDYASKTQLTQLDNKLQLKVEQSGNQNYVSNSDFSKGLAGWETYNSNYISSVAGGWNVPVGSGAYIVGQGDKAVYLKQTVKVPPKAEKYYASAYLNCTNFLNIGGRPEESLWHFYVVLRYADGTGVTKKVPCWDEAHPQGSWKRKAIEFVREESKTVESIDVYLYVRYVEGNFYMSMAKVETDQLGAWVKGINELNTEIVEIDDRGMWVRHEDGSAMNANSKSIDFTNENGRKKMAVKNGGLNYYNYQSGLFVGLDSSTQFSDQYSKFGMQKYASKHCSFYDILYSPTTETDDNLKLANSVFRICFENLDSPTNWRTVKGIHSYDRHRFHEGIDLMMKNIDSCATIFMSNTNTRRKITTDDKFDELQLGFSTGGLIMGQTRSDGSVETAVKIYEKFYMDIHRSCNFMGNEITNAVIRTNYSLRATSPGGSVGADTASIETMLLQEDFSEYDETNNTVVVDMNKGFKSVYANNKRLENENEQLKQENKKLNEELAMTKNALDAVLMGGM